MTTQTLSLPVVAPAARTWDLARRGPAPAVVIGAIGTAVALVSAPSPSYWGDEAASVMSAERSLPSLFAMLGRIDAVHGLYYLFLHFWIGAFGVSELSTRAPSAIALGIAAAGVVTVMRRFGSPLVAALAGGLFVMLPRMAFAGIEARSYALGTAAAVWLAVWFIRLLRSRSSRWWEWVALGAGVGASAYLFLYLLLMAAVFGVVLVSTAEGRRRLRQGILSAAVMLAIAAPMIAIGSSQREQVAFLARRNYANPYSVIVNQWFGWVPLAVIGWLLVIALVVAAPRLDARRRTGVVLAVGWVVLPTAGLLIGNEFVAPMYNLRYVTFSAPALAMLIAGGAAVLPRLVQGMLDARTRRRTARGLPAPSHRLRRPTVTLEIAVVFAIVALPINIAEAGPYAKDGGSDLRQFSTIVSQVSQPGDAVIFDRTTLPSQKPRLAVHLYPQDYVGLIDVGLRVPFQNRTALWDLVSPVSDLDARLSTFDRVIAVEQHGSDSPDLAQLQDQGFVIDTVHHSNRTDVYTLIREIA